MMRKNKFIFLLIILTLFFSCNENKNIESSSIDKVETVTFSCSDESAEICLSLENGNLYYKSSVDIAGFQFSHNECVTEAGGGQSDANGFMVSSSKKVVIAFSLKGDVISAGNGNLITLNGDISKSCLFNFIFSSKKGKALSYSWSTKSEI